MHASAYTHTREELEACQLSGFTVFERPDDLSLFPKCERRTVCVYLLLDPRDGTVRYVGQTAFPVARKASHVGCSAWTAGSPEMVEWKRELRGIGLSPEFVELDYASRSCADGAERYWIRHFRGRGRVYNVSSGR